jgi:hypothetical protein
MQQLRSRAYCTVLLAVLCLFPQATRAEELFHDSFDTDDMSNWIVTRNFLWQNSSVPCQNDGQPAFWQILLQQLGIKIYGPGCYTEIAPSTFRLPADQGYSFEFDMRMPNSTEMDRNYSLRLLNDHNAYGVHLLGNELRVDKLVDGMVRVLPDNHAIFPFQPDVTYHMRNELTADHKIRIFINDVRVIDLQDQEPYLTGGTIAFAASVGAIPSSEVWFDNVVVSTLPDPREIQLDIPYVSQRDPQWSSEQYDAAPDWAKEDATTIDRWGCALSSAVMMLRFHGVTQTPEGLDINPSTLNSWLVAQPDGYVGTGLVNWIALMRLVETFHETHPTVAALEYTYGDFSLETITRQLENANPSIVELPKHFVLARGFDTQTNEARIHDPYTADHTELDPDVSHPISLRLFTPSYTDLSYILVSHAPGIEVHLLNGEVESQTFEESVDDDVSPGDEHTTVIHQIAKPADGDYTITVRADSPTTFNLHLYFYKTDGSVQFETLTGNINRAQQEFILHYAKKSATTITKEDPHSVFLDQLSASYLNGQLHSARTYYQLKRVGEYQIDYASNAASRDRYRALLQSLIQQHENEFDESAYTALNTILDVAPTGLEPVTSRM